MMQTKLKGICLSVFLASFFVSLKEVVPASLILQANVWVNWEFINNLIIFKLRISDRQL